MNIDENDETSPAENASILAVQNGWRVYALNAVIFTAKKRRRAQNRSTGLVHHMWRNNGHWGTAVLNWGARLKCYMVGRQP